MLPLFDDSRLEGWLEDKPRPLTDGAEAVCLGLPFPVLTSRSARAPKLMRRAKDDGVVGEALGSASPSSIAFSLTEVDGELLLPKLLCLFLMLAKDDGWVGEPDSPREAMEVRRRCWAWALAAAVAIGPGYADVPLALGGERPKSSESFWPGEKEARRVVGEFGVGGGEFSLFAIVPGD